MSIIVTDTGFSADDWTEAFTPKDAADDTDQGVDLPYGCRYGGCITCAAKLISGEVDQSAQVALNNRQINDGYVVLCVARPRTDCTLEIGVESHDRLYRNPFLDPLAAHELKADIATPQEKDE